MIIIELEIILLRMREVIQIRISDKSNICEGDLLHKNVSIIVFILYSSGVL